MNGAKHKLLTLCMCVGLIGATSWRSNECACAGQQIIRHIQYSFLLQNTTNHVVKDVRFWTYAPVAQTSTQKCIRVDSTEDHALIKDELGNQILHFRFEELPPYSTRKITIQAQLKLNDSPIRLSTNKNLYLGPERYVESDHPEIQLLAEKFTTGSPFERANSVYRWVAGNVRYSGYTKDNLGALYALKNRRGDCTEYMWLFVAICRASNIPARGVGGYVLNKSDTLEPSAYHNWAEFYDNGLWYISDPQRSMFVKDAVQYIAMQIIGPAKNPMGDANRFLIQGQGVEVKMITSGGSQQI